MWRFLFANQNDKTHIALLNYLLYPLTTCFDPNGEWLFDADRHDDFIKLEFVIREIHELFLEMAALVSQQEDLVSNISANMGTAFDDVRVGAEQLHKAEWYKTSARKKKIILAVILAVLLLIIVLILAWEFSGWTLFFYDSLSSVLPFGISYEF